MATSLHSFRELSDQELLAAVKRLADDECRVTTALIRSLMELDARRLYLQEGFPSMFVYCTQALHLSEHAAYNRIEVARAGRRHPQLLDALEKGDITVTTARLLGPHLTDANCEAVLNAAHHRNKRDVEQLVVSLRPLPDVASMVRKLPVSSAAVAFAGPSAPDSGRPAAPALSSAPATEPGAQPAAAPTLPAGTTIMPACSIAAPPRHIRHTVTPLSPERYKIQFTARRPTHDKLRRAQDLLRHVIPNGDPAEIFDRALTVLIADLERRRLAAVERPQPCRPMAEGSRHIPAAVRRAVWTRDGGRCAFLGRRARCPETGFLECTTSARSRPAAARPLTTSSCAAGRTTRTRRDSSSVTRRRIHLRRTPPRPDVRSGPDAVGTGRPPSATWPSASPERFLDPPTYR